MQAFRIRTLAESLTLANLISKLVESKGVSFIGLVSLTEPDWTKLAPFDVAQNVRKLTIGVYMTGASYERRVNRIRTQDGNSERFVVGPRKWGNRIPNTPMIHHVKDGQSKFYLEVMATKNRPQTSYISIRACDYGAAVFIPNEWIKPGSTANGTFLRTYGLDSIVQATFRGQQYTTNSRLLDAIAFGKQSQGWDLVGTDGKSYRNSGWEAIEA